MVRVFDCCKREGEKWPAGGIYRQQAVVFCARLLGDLHPASVFVTGTVNLLLCFIRRLLLWLDENTCNATHFLRTRPYPEQANHTTSNALGV